MMLNESMSGEDKLSPKERRKYSIKGNERELTRRIEDGELERDNYGLEGISYLQLNDQPLSRKEIGDRGLVINQHELEELGYLDIILPNGEIMTIFPEDTGYNPGDSKDKPGGRLIIFPEDLGNASNKE